MRETKFDARSSDGQCSEEDTHLSNSRHAGYPAGIQARNMPIFPFIALERDSGIPVYRQIYEAYRQSILNGDILSGMSLPASRLLAKHLQVARMTVLNAYDQLQAEGYLDGKVGSGTYVAAQLPEELLQVKRSRAGANLCKQLVKRPQLSSYGNRLAQNTGLILKRHGKSVSVPFQQGIPALAEFPFDVWSKISQRWQRKSDVSVFGYNDPEGFPPLREAVSSYLVSARGLRCKPEQVIITNGSQQSLNLIARVFLNEGDEVWIEDPCYFGGRDILGMVGARLIPVPIDEEGFNFEHARKKCPQARIAYVTPSHQYPLGVTMSVTRRLQLLKWAAENRSFLIEDDYNSEFRYAGLPLTSLQGLDKSGSVIYLGTFSKTTFPALRLGCLVVPDDLIEVFTAARALDDLHSSLTEQAVLAEFIAGGHLAKHVRLMRSTYQHRQEVLVAESKKHLAGLLEVNPADAGMHLIGWLPEGVNDREVSHLAKSEGLFLSPVSAHSISHHTKSGLLLGYAAYDERQIAQAVIILARLLEKVVGK